MSVGWWTLRRRGRTSPRWRPTVHPVVQSGTSLSAPFATGLAGLLLSFDPRLSSDSLKTLIVEGARRGGRTAGGVPILNAYKSLRAAAQRDGAPLCGNRVWADGGRVFAERDRAAGTREELFTLGERAGYLNVRHGGRRIDMLGDSTWNTRTFVLHNTRWQEVTEPVPGVEAPNGGSYYSLLQASHGADSVVLTRRSASGFDVIIRDLATGVERRIATVPSGDWSTVTDACVLYEPDYLGGGCAFGRHVGVGSATTSRATSAFVPTGEHVLVAVSHTTVLSSLNGWAPCPGNPDFSCASLSGSSRSAGTALYRVAIRDGGTSLVRDLGGMGTSWLSASEDGAEAIEDVGSTVSESVSPFEVVNAGTSYEMLVLRTLPTAYAQTNCAVRSTSLPSGASAGAIPSPDVCTGLPGNGTIAPVAVRR